MNKYAKRLVYIIICIMFMVITKSYACDLDPIPRITSDPDALNIYLTPDDSVQLNNNSYDPYDRIASWHWNIFKCVLSFGHYNWVPQYSEYCTDSSLTFSPSALGLGPGLYSVDLVVTDIENNPVDGWDMYLADKVNDWHGTRFIYVLGGDAECDPYVAYGEEIEIGYDIIPDNAYATYDAYADWSYDEAAVFLVDPSLNCPLQADIGELSSMGSPPECVEQMHEFSGSFTWDGMGGSYPFDCFPQYSGIQIPPGTYELWTYVESPDGVAVFVEKSQDVTVVGVTGLTVTNATQTNVTGSHNWAAVKGSGDVIIEATLNPTVPNDNVPDVLQWQGGSSVSGNPLQRKVSKSYSNHYNVTATVGSSSDYVDIWIIWASVQIKMTGTTPANAVQFGAAYDGTENLGAISYDGGTKARGKVVPIGTISPSGVNSIISSGFTFERQRMSHDFIDGVKHPIYWDTTWQPDTSYSMYQNLTPDNNDQIYDRDAPSIGLETITDSDETYNNFRQWITWNGERASTLYAYWYWEGYRKIGESPEITYKLVIEGNLSLPDEDEAHYDPPD